jgi:ABC-type Zn uptake system ZnuABC Zn-binding protein ZnuA
MSRQEQFRWRAPAGGLVLALAAVVPFVSVGCSSDDQWPDRPGPKVVVSFAPLYCFAVNVAGEDAVVKNMMTSSGPHHFNPTDADARLLRKADLFFVNGLGLDNQVAATLKRGSGNRKLRVVELGTRLPANMLVEGSHDHHHHDGHDHHHEHGADPHVWLSPDLAIILVEAIRDELMAIDPAHADGYDRRAADYIAKLKKLKADGVEMLKGKQDRKLVTFHEALAYFAKTYNLDIKGVVQKNPGVEPSAAEVNALIALCKKENVRLIAVEPQYTANTSARTIIDQLKAKEIPDPQLVEIDPLETITPDELAPDVIPSWYERKMRANLDALAKAMK